HCACYLLLPSFPTRRSSDLLVIGVPRLIWKRRTTKQEIGVQRGPIWRDIWLTPFIYTGYLILSGIGVFVVMQLLPSVDMTQAQSDRKSTRLNSSHVKISYAV